jgi:Chaperone of endosialidase
MGCVLVGFLSLVLSMAAQTSGSPASAQVPPLIQFSSVATDQGGSSLSGVVSITFSLYTGQQGGEALWTETQNNVQLDPTGHYSAQLGVTKPNGVPTALFTSGEAHWLGVQIAEQAEQPRVLLLSVPYALKAGDATTIGGLPPAAFVLAAPLSGAMASVPTTFTGSATSPPDAPPAGSVTGSGITNFIPLWTSASSIGSSVLFQSGTGSTAKLGINTSTPATTLDVKGTSTIRGLLNLPATGAATATAGKNSQPLDLVASAFNSGTSNAVSQTFRWQAEPAGNDTSSPTGTLNLLFAEGTSSFAETGLNIAGNGQIKFATGQTFPGTGDGTVTSVGSGLGLTGGPITGSGTLAIDTSVVPQLGASSNTFTGNQVVNGNVTATNLTATGTVTAPTVNGTIIFGDSTGEYLGAAALSGTGGVNNLAVGLFAFLTNSGGGSDNTAIGTDALRNNTSGESGTAVGFQALDANTTGFENTAVGIQALVQNTTGQENTAVGGAALGSNTTGSALTCVGYNCTVAAPNLRNATAIGAHATVDVSDALVLGSVAGVNGATATVRVGVGTTKPTNLLTLGQGFGPSISDGWATYSSRRWKTNIQPLHNALGMVNRMRGVSYDLKDSGKHEIGVIAEEVGEVVPEVVSYEENGKDARGVDYSRLTALLIEATKEQQREIQHQQAVLRTQAAAIRDLKSELRATRQTLQKVKTQVAAAQPALVAAK